MNSSVITNKKNAKKIKTRKGFISFDFILTIGLIALVLSGILLVLLPKAKEMIAKRNIVNTYQTIQSGLSSYYSDTNFYPGGSGWTWNTNNAYIPQDIINKGWSYSCASNTMTIETPAISNPKVRTSVENQLNTMVSKNNGSATLDGNKVKITIPDTPCK